MKDRVLLIEDDPQIVELVRTQISDLGLEFDSIDDGARGLERARQTNYSLVVLDLNLPSLGGMEICRTLRTEQELLPILMLTARAEDIDKILGLELGADDYMTKPFNVKEFRARVRALLRRSSASEKLQRDREVAEKISFRGVHIDTRRAEVTLDGEKLDLTPTEYELLILLASNPGKVFSRDQLMEIVLESDSEIYKDNIYPHISRLRGKLGGSQLQSKYIITVRGKGYRFADENDPE